MFFLLWRSHDRRVVDRSSLECGGVRTTSYVAWSAGQLTVTLFYKADDSSRSIPGTSPTPSPPSAKQMVPNPLVSSRVECATRFVESRRQSQELHTIRAARTSSALVNDCALVVPREVHVAATAAVAHLLRLPLRFKVPAYETSHASLSHKYCILTRSFSTPLARTHVYERILSHAGSPSHCLSAGRSCCRGAASRDGGERRIKAHEHCVHLHPSNNAS